MLGHPRSERMMPHHLAQQPAERCVVCGKEGGPSHKVIGLGTICMRCGLELVECSLCGNRVKRMTMTYLRGRGLCLMCYAKERERGAKRLTKSIDGSELTLEELVKKALTEAPEGYILVGLKLNQNSKTVWTVEYEREDVYVMRCS